MKKTAPLNILVIGLGHHARRIYLPALNKYKNEFDLRIFGLDLITSKVLLESYFQKKGFDFNVLYLEHFSPDDNLPEAVKEKLNRFAQKHNINAVIISTDPVTHKMYAKWALENKLHILMDKPITTRAGISKDLSQATKIESDYVELLNLYKKVQVKKETFFLINTQRRYEVGYKKVFDLIKEVSDKFNVPVTSIQAMHSDGVWIFPDEIVEQKVHPYNEGYGKCSHSGFHIFDIVWQFYQAGYIKEKGAQSGEVFSSFVSPQGSLLQINQDDYLKYFGEKYFDRTRRKSDELNDLFADYGENDAFSIVRLLREDKNICNISINLLHNSLSQRSWMEPSKDLYKGNGRIKHQSYYIQQGPFQCIQIHNYQSSDQQEISNKKDYELGGNNHFEIYVFRNEKMFGSNTKALEVINLKDLVGENNDQTRLYHETAKDQVILEFLASARGGVSKDSSTSSITSYMVPVQIMSSVYKSNVNYRDGKNPLVKFEINEN